MYKKNPIQMLMPFLLGIIFIFIISAQGTCGKLNRNKVNVGSSDVSTFQLNAPTSLSNTVVSSYQINLTWQDNSNNEDGFEIERRTNTNSGYSLFATVEVNVSSFVDDEVSPYIIYYYRVRAFNTIGDRSAYSNEVSSSALGLLWQSVAAGSCHTIALSNSGTIWGWGRNDWFQLGLGDVDNRAVLNLITTEADWIAIRAGGFHCLGIKSNPDGSVGTLWAWGGNEYGQLGLGDTSFDGDVPYQVGSDSDWSTEITGGEYFTVALKTNGTMWSWGDNSLGQLGLGDTNDRNSPARIETFSGWANVSSGSDSSHAIALRTDGTLWSWGYNAYGQLGLGDANNRNTPSQIGTDSNWSKIAEGGFSSYALKTNPANPSGGEILWAWGDNSYGQLGDGSKTQRTTPKQVGTASDWFTIASGRFSVIALKTNQTIWSWGLNVYGDLGLGDKGWGMERITPTQIGTESDWKVIANAGRACGGHSIAIKTDSTIWIWGYNTYGQLGLADRNDRSAPTQTGFFPLINPPSSLFVTAVSPSRVDLYWADLSYNETGFSIERRTLSTDYSLLANVSSDVASYSDMAVSGFTTYYYRVRAYSGSDNSDYSNEVYIATAGNWSYISAGFLHSVAIKTNRTLWSWGCNGSYQLGLGDADDRNTPSQMGSLSDWDAVGAGMYHTIARKTNGTLWTWGSNNWYGTKAGQLGLGDPDIVGYNRDTPSQVGTDSDWVSFAGGLSHTVAKKTNNTLWSWGGTNYYCAGQLGLNGTYRVYVPTQIGTDSDWSLVSSGGYHNIGLKTNGTIWGWGYNYYGQLGISDTNKRSSPVQIGTDSDWNTVACGFNHSLAKKYNGTIWSWGCNSRGRLGLDDYINRNTPSQIGTDTDWFIITGGGGDENAGGQSLGLKIDGTIWTWGANDFGQLGLGDYIVTRIYPTQIGPDTDWANVFIWGYHTLALKNNGTLWTCGYNEQGQLGLEDSGIGKQRSIPTMIKE
jgi:alpha-tubulin suppressor-like RCC1 family protein